PRGAEEPLGMRAVPAAASLAAGLHRAETADRDGRASSFDLWAIRILGTMTAVCFLVLLVLLLGVFL
ncbi:MAG: hypothetical protein JWO90_2029, partial [Solirubrobacterales bacterium]|nr:hypothetical protein [Solirubrobacterales bacterium]